MNSFDFDVKCFSSQGLPEYGFSLLLLLIPVLLMAHGIRPVDRMPEEKEASGWLSTVFGRRGVSVEDDLVSSMKDLTLSSSTRELRKSSRSCEDENLFPYSDPNKASEALEQMCIAFQAFTVDLTFVLLALHFSASRSSSLYVLTGECYSHASPVGFISEVACVLFKCAHDAFDSTYAFLQRSEQSCDGSHGTAASSPQVFVFFLKQLS